MIKLLLILQIMFVPSLKKSDGVLFASTQKVKTSVSAKSAVVDYRLKLRLNDRLSLLTVNKYDIYTGTFNTSFGIIIKIRPRKRNPKFLEFD